MDNRNIRKEQKTLKNTIRKTDNLIKDRLILVKDWLVDYGRIILPVILLALNEGRLIVIDELDAKLHPKLLRYVIMLFKNPTINRHGAQLLFTSHDMSTMKNTVFRRDEIWFAAEDEQHQSKIYSLSDIRQEDNTRIKNTAAYDKQYLEGRYGADPYLSNMIGGGWT